MNLCPTCTRPYPGATCLRPDCESMGRLSTQLDTDAATAYGKRRDEAERAMKLVADFLAAEVHCPVRQGIQTELDRLAVQLDYLGATNLLQRIRQNY